MVNPIEHSNYTLVNPIRNRRLCARKPCQRLGVKTSEISLDAPKTEIPLKDFRSLNRVATFACTPNRAHLIFSAGL